MKKYIKMSCIMSQDENGDISIEMVDNEQRAMVCLYKDEAGSFFTIRKSPQPNSGMIDTFSREFCNAEASNELIYLLERFLTWEECEDD